MGRRTDVEWLAFERGVKPAIRRAVDPNDVASEVARFERAGAAVVHVPALRIGGRSVDVLYVARDRGAAEALAGAEARSLAGDGEGHRRLGAALGFPACCVEAFCVRLARGIDVLPNGSRGHAEDYVAARDAWVPHANPLLNCLLFRERCQLISFYPCRFDCDAAGARARAIAEALRDASRSECADVVKTLARPIAIRADGSRAWVTRAQGRIVTAEAPHRFDSDVVDAGNAAFAGTLVGAAVHETGAVGDAEIPAPTWYLPFGE